MVCVTHGILHFVNRKVSWKMTAENEIAKTTKGFFFVSHILLADNRKFAQAWKVIFF